MYTFPHLFPRLIIIMSKYQVDMQGKVKRDKKSSIQETFGLNKAVYTKLQSPVRQYLCGHASISSLFH